MDSLNYSYRDVNYNNTNQLQQVQDLSADTAAKGYRSGTHGYAYDGNGNMTADSSKNMTVAYNILNQPATVNAGIYSYPSTQTLYYHDANGEKLARYYLDKTIGPKGEFDFTFYDDGLQYESKRLAFSSEQDIFLQTEEGRMFPYSTDTTNYYQYYLTDHLGNTRIAFDTPNDTLKVEQQDDYMPFGMEISKLNMATPKNEYLYNKKELQEGSQLYDYGARFYDPVVARWTTPDPLVEDEYWNKFDKEYGDELADEGYDFDDKEIKDGRKNAGKFFDLLGSHNIITSENSALHYNSSLYSYVLDSPIDYIDPIGLDTGKVHQLNEVKIVASKKASSNWWIGPGLIALGQPLKSLKPYGALGSEEGSSIASYALSKAIPWRSALLKQGTRKVVAKLVGKQIAKKVGTAVVGRALGRLVPYVGWAMFTYDIVTSDFVSDMRKENEKNADDMMWHLK